MMLLRFTSGDRVVGLESDDGFTIGQLSNDSLFLLAAGTAVGMLGCVLYALVRTWIPERWRAPAFGLLGAVAAGSFIVHAEGIDFFLLEPRWLAVVLFVALPGLGCVLLSMLAERSLNHVGEVKSLLVAGFPVLAFVVLGPLALVLLAATAVAYALDAGLPLVRWWQSAPIAWIGRIALTVWAAVAAIALVNDIRDIAALPA